MTFSICQRFSALIVGALLLGIAWPGFLFAQPADLPIQPAKTSIYPAGVTVISTPAGRVYADGRGRVLYGMDMRVLLRVAPDPSVYCAQEACDRLWEPLLAPAGSIANIRFPTGADSDGEVPAPGFFHPQIAPDWTIINGPSGPQWVYKGWHMVFTSRSSEPGATEFDGHENYTWNTLKFVPPQPMVNAPAGVKAKLIGRSYVLVAPDERILFTGKCAADCAQWQPFSGGLGNRGFGDWSINRHGDTPHWHLKGRPVFLSGSNDPDNLPAGSTFLTP